MSEYYGRGVITPYQYLMSNNGDILENRFGKINILGEIRNPEMMDEAKRDVATAFSIINMANFYHDLYPYQQRLIDNLWLYPRQSGKEYIIEKLIRECAEQNISIGTLFEEWKRNKLLEIMKYGSIDALNSINIYNHGKYLGTYNFEIDKLVQNYKEEEYAKHTMKMISNRVNKNMRVYYDDYNPYEKGQKIWILSNPERVKEQDTNLDIFLHINRYGRLRKDTEIPHVKLNIERKNHAKRTNFGNRFK